MSKSKKSDTEQQQFWQMAIETFQSSGLSVRQFCKQEGLSEPGFYSWRRKLAKADEAKMEKQRDSSSSAFIKVAIPKSNQVLLELELSSGNTLRIRSGADNKTLNNVLSVLREVGLC